MKYHLYICKECVVLSSVWSWQGDVTHNSFIMSSSCILPFMTRHAFISCLGQNKDTRWCPAVCVWGKIYVMNTTSKLVEVQVHTSPFPYRRGIWSWLWGILLNCDLVRTFPVCSPDVGMRTWEVKHMNQVYQRVLLRLPMAYTTQEQRAVGTGLGPHHTMGKRKGDWACSLLPADLHTPQSPAVSRRVCESGLFSVSFL